MKTLVAGGSLLMLTFIFAPAIPSWLANLTFTSGLLLLITRLPMNLQPHNLREFDAKRRRQGNWLLAAILAFLLFAIWAVTASAETVYVKDTGSMRPWIAHGGGFYALQRLPFNQVRPGMVIVWKHPTAGFIAHRVIEVHPGKLWTKGDSNRLPDNDWCYPSEYLGVILSATQP